MNPDWSPRLKLVYAVLCLVLFTAAMMLIGQYVATPLEDWARPYMQAAPEWLMVLALLSLPPAWYLAWRYAKYDQRRRRRAS